MFRIGHPIYQGSNRAFDCANIHLAVMELVARGVGRKVARAMCRLAQGCPGHHYVMLTDNGQAVIELKFV